uniref:Uncharacterized protein n=1 Tax=Romanomermis culicivorax TaxID=13658 RepID=A0A915J873_ROMCU
MALHPNGQISRFNIKSTSMPTKKATNQELFQPTRTTSSNDKNATNRIATAGIKLEIADLLPPI